MSHVIKKVKRHKIEIIHEDVWCSKCGSGMSIKETEEGKVVREFPEHRKLIGQPCKHCGHPLELITNDFSRTIPGYTLIKCDCGEEIQCEHFTNTCYCGADYDMNGSRLAPREFWGEETGEHWTDIINIGRKDFDF